MKSPKILQAFIPSQVKDVQNHLATKVIKMMGRKFEEGDWTEIYCKVKNIPDKGWSNLNLDIMHNGLGVEQKMLCYPSKKDIKDACGQTLMHPSATRSIRIPETENDPNKVMTSILNQYSEFIERRTNEVKKTATAKNAKVDMRTGWLLWQTSLRQFLYFEEEMLKPDPNDYYAEWVESGGGSRKTSRNLWIYETETNKKRYSVTTQAGAKIQPYFDVPSPRNKNLYVFNVIGEYVHINSVRIWLSKQTCSELEIILGKDFSSEALSDWIVDNIPLISTENIMTVEDDFAIPFVIDKDAYNLLNSKLKGLNDDHCLQLFIQSIQK